MSDPIRDDPCGSPQDTKKKPRFNFLKSRPNQNKVSVSFNLITKQKHKTKKYVVLFFISENAQRRAVNSNSLDNRESRETFYFSHQLCIVLCIGGCVCRYRSGGWYLIIAEILSLLEIFLLFIIRWRLFQLEKTSRRRRGGGGASSRGEKRRLKLFFLCVLFRRVV